MSALKLTRDQFASFLNDFEQIKQFEALFSAVSATPDEIQNVTLTAGAALSGAQQAMARVIALAQALEQTPPTPNALPQFLEFKQDAEQTPPEPKHTSTSTDYIDFPLNAPYVTKERRLGWSPDDGTLDLGGFNDVVLKLNQQSCYYAKNTSGGSIAKGKAVMFSGVVGSSGKITFTNAVADGSSPAEYMMGITAETIANNGFGYVTQFGLVRGFDTSAWTDGDLLYFDATTPGALTNTAPTAPAIHVPIAVVINASAGSGSIFVRMAYSNSLLNLQDVYAPAPIANGEILIGDTAQARWEKTTLTAGANIAITNGAGSITIATTGASGTFTSADGKTITVADGAITSIV